MRAAQTCGAQHRFCSQAQRGSLNGNDGAADGDVQTMNDSSARPQTGEGDERENGMNQGENPWRSSSNSVSVVEIFDFNIGFYLRGLCIIGC